MTKRNFVLIFRCFLVLAIAFSVFQYTSVNKPYKGYKLNIINSKTESSINALDLTQTFGQAKTETIKDEMLNEITNYIIPFTFKNSTDKTIDLHPEFYRLMHGEDMTQSIDFIDDKTKKRVLSIPPDTIIHGKVIFTYNDNNVVKPLQLNINDRKGMVINLFKIPVFE